MLGAFVNAFRTPDLRRKLLFVLFIIAVFRLGAQIPSPGVNVPNVQACFAAARKDSNAIFQAINLFSGRALLQLTVFALGIMPYITASIIFRQLLVVVIPRSGNLEEGRPGRPRSRSTPATSPWALPSCRPPASLLWPAPRTSFQVVIATCSMTTRCLPSS